MADKPNILLITADQFRGDCISALGHPVVETPYLDQLSSEGTVFTRAYAAVPSCIAARASILTGLTQGKHGRVGYKDGVPWTYQTTLPGELAKAGYHTQGVGKMHFYPARSLMGFHNVVLHDGYLHHERDYPKGWYGLKDDYTLWLKERAGQEADLIEHGLNCNSWVSRPWPYAEHLHPTNWVVTQSIDFMRRRDPSKPFFLWMSFVRPHAPLDPPPFYLDMYMQKDMPPVPVGDWVEDTPDLHEPRRRVDASKADLPEHLLKRARAGYYGLITHIDHQIGRFIEVLGEHEALQNTVILFTSDHGELMGDHHRFRKVLPYEGSTHVPFIVRFPKSMEKPKNTTVEAPVELMDVMPTILDAAGVPIPDTLDGKSVLPLMRTDGTPWREFIHGEHAAAETSNHWVTDGREKYVWFSQTGREQLFDLVNDPNELHDLVGKKPERVKKWRSILVQELSGRQEGYVQNGKLVTGRPVTPLLDNVKL